MNNNNNIFERIDFLKCRKALNELGFTDHSIDTALDQLNITKRDLCDSQGFRGGVWNHIKVKEFDRRGAVYYKEYKGAYYIDKTEMGEYWLIPSQYQGLKHGKIIFQLLKNRFNWFDTFNKITIKKIEPEFNERTRLKDLSEDLYNLTLSEIISMFDKEQEIEEVKSLWSLYEMRDSKNYEIYLSTEYGSLYVPIIAIINKDFSIIEKRMKEYHGWYSGLSGSKDDIKEKTNKALLPLQSKEAKQLKEYFSLNHLQL